MHEDTRRADKAASRLAPKGDDGLFDLCVAQIWLRNTMWADYSEVQHGGGILQRFFANDANKTAFTQAMDA
jgi:hypothetical protein